MDNGELKKCIDECQFALRHLSEAMSQMDNEYSKQKLEHAANDIEECIAACHQLLM